MHTYRAAIVGAQTGDEGKGVRVDYLAKRAVELARMLTSSSHLELPVLMVRYQGGAGAGHTAWIDGVKYALSQVPSGILIAGTYNLMGEGTFIDPTRLVKEIKNLRDKGVEITPKRFGIASNAHMTLDYHVRDDSSNSARTDGKHTSTGRGIKQTAVDKAGRVGVRFAEFLDRDGFIAALRKRFPIGPPEPHSSLENLADSYQHQIAALKDYCVLQEDVFAEDRKFVLLEGAQGFQLDIDKGLYPGVTSSGSATPPISLHRRIGVVKFYESSIGGDRPFIGQIEDRDLESRLRDKWGEKGTVTGKPRNLGWLDAVALKHAVRGAELDRFISSCGDRMEDLAKEGQKVKIIVAYEVDGKRYDRWDTSFHNRQVIARAKPVFEEHEPWSKFIDGNGLTKPAASFVKRVEELTGVRFIAHGYGPGVDDVLTVEDLMFEGVVSA